MKFITTLYQTKDLEFRLTLSPRARRDSDGKPVANDDDAMLVHYVSKVGSESLIFNPSVYITVRSRYSKDRNEEAVIPMNQFYRFVTMLTQVYNSLQSKGVYREDGGLFLDQKGARAAARRMSLFRASLTLFPDIISGPDNTQIKGVGFQVDKTKIGSISHMDTISLIDILDHMDLATYTIVVGLLEEMEGLNTGQQIIIDKLNHIEELLERFSPDDVQKHGTSNHSYQPYQTPRESSSAGLFNWSSVGLGM